MYGGLEYKDADIIYARHLGNKLAVTVKLYGHKHKSSSLVTEFIIFDINGNIQNKNLKIQGDQYMIHLLTEDAFIKCDIEENRVQLCLIKQSFFKYKIQYKHQIAYNQNLGRMVHVRCYENYIFIVQQNNFVLIYNLFHYAGQVGGLILVSQLTGELYSGIKLENILYHVEFQYYPVVVVQQENHFQVINFSRKEILQFQIPEISLNIKSADNQFQRFLLQDSAKQNVFFLNGIGVIAQFDWVNDKLRIVLFTTTLNQKTTILYSNVNVLLSYEMQEIQDILYLGNLFLMAGCENLPVTAAAKYVLNHIQLFINQQLNKKLIYNSIQKQHKNAQLVDFIPWDFYNLLSHKQSSNTLIFELGEQIITDNDTIITLQRFLNRAPNLKPAEEGKRSTSNNTQNPSYSKDEQQTKEPRIYPVLFNYTPKGTFEQQVKEIVSAFKQFNPERTERRRSFSISAYDDSESEQHSGQKMDWRKSLDLDRFFNINQKQKETFLEQFELIPCPSIFTTEYHILTPASRFSQLSTSNKAYNKIMVFDYLHQQIKTVQFQINLFELNHFNNYITEMAQLYNTFSKDAENPNEMVSIIQRHQHNLLQIRSECLYISLRQDIILNTYWKSGLFSHNFELNQLIIPEWIRYINIVLDNEILDTKFTALLTITKSIVDTYLMVSYLQVAGTKPILMQIAQTLYQIISENENSIILSLQKLLQDPESNQTVLKSKSVGELFRNLTYDTTLVSSTQLNQHENAQNIQIKQGINLYNKNLIEQFIYNQHIYFLPDSDGELLSYSQMYQICDLGIFNPHTIQSFNQEISQINAVPQYPPYYKKQQYRIQYFGSNQYIQQTIQKMQLQFYHQKALFYGMNIRNNIYSSKLNQPNNSIIYRSTFNVLQQFKEICQNQANIPQNQVNALIQTILDNIVQQFSINIDFLAQKIIQREQVNKIVKFDELISIIEAIEILGVQAQDNCYESIVQFVMFVCQNMKQIRNKHKKINTKTLFKVDSNGQIANIKTQQTITKSKDVRIITKRFDSQLYTTQDKIKLNENISSISNTETVMTTQNDQDNDIQSENLSTNVQKTSLYNIDSILIDQLISYSVIKLQ